LLHLEEEAQSQLSCFATHLAWLGVCLLTAAFGSAPGSTWRTTETFLGVFGLALGLALKAMSRSRSMLAERVGNKKLQDAQSERLLRFTTGVPVTPTLAETSTKS